MQRYLPLIILLINFQCLNLQASECFFENMTSVVDETSGSFLNDNLLKPTEVVIKDDITPARLEEFQALLANRKMHHHMSGPDKHAILKDYPIENIIAAPGHRQLRNIKQVEGLVDYIKTSGGGDFSHDKILLNIVTDDNGAIKSVDLWNAHHRLVAYLEAGHKNIGDLKLDNMEILVNGAVQSGEKWGHYLSSGGVNWKNLHEFTAVPAGGDIRVGTISVDGGLSNAHLGSRNTLKQLHFNTLRVARRPKIGVYFGTFDPIHEGHMQVIRQTIEKMGLDELIVVPNYNPIHKAGALSAEQRLEMVARRIANEPKVNLYTGNSSTIIDKFGRNPFFEHLIQTYGTYDMYQIIGADSFSSIVANGEYAASQFRKYVVLPRSGVSLPDMANLENAMVLDVADESGLSSSQVREAIQQGKKIPEGAIAPEVESYIRENSLYR